MQERIPVVTRCFLTDGSAWVRSARLFSSERLPIDCSASRLHDQLCPSSALSPACRNSFPHLRKAHTLL